MTVGDDALVALAFDVSPLAELPLVRRVLGEPPALRVPELDPAVRAIARRGWEDRARGEYQGVFTVRRLHGLLVDLNAPLDLQELALVMMVQEQRHARFCVAAARALGSDGELAFPLLHLQQPRTAAPLATQLVDTIVRTYAIGEIVAYALARHTVAVLPPSPFRDLHRAITRDEVLHARIGAPLIPLLRSAAWLDWPGDDHVRAVAASARAEMAARDVIELDEAALFDDPAARGALLALGIPPSDGFRAAYDRALAVDVPRALGAFA